MKCKDCKHWEQYNKSWGSCEKLPDEIRCPSTLRFDSCEVHMDFFCGCYDGVNMPPAASHMIPGD
jgi:hypothetical protein